MHENDKGISSYWWCLQINFLSHTIICKSLYHMKEGGNEWESNIMKFPHFCHKKKMRNPQEKKVELYISFI